MLVGEEPRGRRRIICADGATDFLSLNFLFSADSNLKFWAFFSPVFHFCTSARTCSDSPRVTLELGYTVDIFYVSGVCGPSGRQQVGGGAQCSSLRKLHCGTEGSLKLLLLALVTALTTSMTHPSNALAVGKEGAALLDTRAGHFSGFFAIVFSAPQRLTTGCGFAGGNKTQHTWSSHGRLMLCCNKKKKKIYIYIQFSAQLESCSLARRLRELLSLRVSPRWR